MVNFPVRWKRRVVIPAGAALLACALSGCLGWFSQFSSATANLASVSCLSVTTCVAVGGGPGGGLIEQTTNAGGSWSGSSPSGTPALTSVSCSGGTGCVGVGSDSVVATADAGRTWDASTVSLPQVLVGSLFPTSQEAVFTSVSCADATHCWAATSTNTVEATTDGGATWTSETWPIPAYAGGYGSTSSDALDDDLQITCPTVNVCVGVGKQNYIIYPPPEATVPMLVVYTALVVTTDDGGQTWSAQGFGDGDLTAVSCSSSTSCVALGSNGVTNQTYGLSSTDGGATWGVTTLASNSSLVTSGVDCLAAMHCIAVGSANNSGYVVPSRAPRTVE